MHFATRPDKGALKKLRFKKNKKRKRWNVNRKQKTNPVFPLNSGLHVLSFKFNMQLVGLLLIIKSHSVVRHIIRFGHAYSKELFFLMISFLSLVFSLCSSPKTFFFVANPFFYLEYFSVWKHLLLYIAKVSFFYYHFYFRLSHGTFFLFLLLPRSKKEQTSSHCHDNKQISPTFFLYRVLGSSLHHSLSLSLFWFFYLFQWVSVLLFTHFFNSFVYFGRVDQFSIFFNF